MQQMLRWILGVGIAVVLVAGPISYARWRQPQYRNLRVVKDNVLLRSGQLNPVGLKSAINDYGIKTVVTFRGSTKPGMPAPDAAEERYCIAEALNYHRIAAQEWGLPDGSVPAQEGVGRFLEIMDNPDNYPVLIHCLAGIHRTGAFSAIYRMEYDRWTNEQALAELRANGYTTIEDDWNLLEYLENYQPRWIKMTKSIGP